MERDHELRKLFAALENRVLQEVDKHELKLAELQAHNREHCQSCIEGARVRAALVTERTNAEHAEQKRRREAADRKRMIERDPPVRVSLASDASDGGEKLDLVECEAFMLGRRGMRFIAGAGRRVEHELVMPRSEWERMREDDEVAEFFANGWLHVDEVAVSEVLADVERHGVRGALARHYL